MIVLEGKPESVNSIYRSVCRGRFPSVYMSNEGKAIKESFQWQIKSQWTIGKLKGKIGVSVRMFFGDEKRRDIDNYHKIILDSLKGICFDDDSQIYDLRATKEVDKFMPRVEIDIRVL